MKFFIRASQIEQDDSTPLDQMDRVTICTAVHDADMSAEGVAVEELSPRGGYVFGRDGNPCKFVAPRA